MASALISYYRAKYYAYAGNNPVNFNDPAGLCPGQVCQSALATAGQNSSAIDRANANWSVIQSAAANNGIDPALLAAIGVRETGFRNIAQIGGGQGTGVFQIDLGQNPNVTTSQAYNLQFSANFAANMLETNMASLSAAHPNLNSTQLLQATAASYNFGAGNISGNPQTIDVGTTGGNYGSNVLGLMSCFCAGSSSGAVPFQSLKISPSAPSYLSTPQPPPTFQLDNNFGAAEQFGAAGGFLLYPNKPNTNQLQQVYSK